MFGIELICISCYIYTVYTTSNKSRNIPKRKKEKYKFYTYT